MPNFDSLVAADAAAVILKAATPDYVKINFAYMKGDHFQGGREWVGPPPPPAMYDAAMLRLQKAWCPSPVINEMIENHMVGVVGREPAFEIVLARDENADSTERDAINAAIGSWWDERNGLEVIQEWVQRLRWAGRATLRLFVPPDLMQASDENEDEVTAFTLPDGVSTPQEALQYIYLEAPDVEAATVYQDPRSKREAGLYSYFEDVVVNGNKRKKRRIEVTFVADAEAIAGQTVLRVLQDKTVIGEIAFPCGGQALMYEARLPLLFNDPVRRLQQALNMINTMLPLNDAYAGFRSKDYINVEPPRDEAAPLAGPSQFMMWYSAPYYEVDANGRRTGEIKYYPPQLITTEPVDSTGIRADLDHFDRLIRRFCKQEYTLLAGDGNASAVALIQKRAVFANDLLKTGPAVEGALRWLQTALWCFALYLSGHEAEIEGFREEYRATARVKPYTGPLTPDEQRVVMEQYTAKLMSRETAMALLGCEDLDAELARIEEDAQRQPGTLVAQSESE